MVTKVSVLGKEQIIIGQDLTSVMMDEIRNVVPSSSKIAIITDDHILPLYPSIISAFDEYSPLVMTIRPGESSKSYETKERLERTMLQAHYGRNTVVVALGGGVVGDLAGFVASTYMRGVPFIQIPTTLLAMVDSSIGGKTGIDTPEGKNLVGAFWQPLRVFINIDFLSTLPIRQFRNGLAECIKMFAIGDAEMFSKVEDERITFDTPEGQELLLEIITKSASMKADIVTRDEREGGLRELLNFGHTIGHGIEGLMSDSMLHGECVSIGMIKEAELSRALGYLSSADVARLKKCLQVRGLPVSLPPCLSIDDIMLKMAVDKKNTAGGNKKCVLLSSIGKTVEQRAMVVPDDLIRMNLARSLAVIPPKNPIKGSIRVPGSKSISNRVLLLAALGKGTCRISGLLHSDDTKVMMNAITTLNIASFDWEDNGDVLVVHGGGGSSLRKEYTESKELDSPVSVYLGNAGTASRFLTTVCTMIDSKNTAQTMLTGNHRMYVRPVTDLINALRENGCKLEYKGKEGCLPLLIEGTGLPGGDITLDAKISSQYVSSVLMCSPYAQKEITLNIAGGKAISQSYIDMTVSLMQQFGIPVKKIMTENTLSYIIPQGIYQNPENFEVEADASSSTYPLALAAVTGGEITVNGVGSNSLQGDSGFCRVLEQMGCVVTQTENSTTVIGKRPLKGIDVDMEPLTDAFMTAAVVAAICTDETSKITRITGIANQRVKECNRIAAMVEELGKCGVYACELPDGIEIHGKPLNEIHGAIIDCRDDHRIAMSFGVLGTVVPGIIIDDKECVSKTYTEFWEDLYREFNVSFDTNDTTTDVKPQPNEPGQFPVIIVIGMRGAGKSFQSKQLANYLSIDCIDLDDEFEIIHSQTVKDVIEKEGWDTFRQKEYSVLDITLDKITKPTVISCGGGIIEYQASRNLLSKQEIVIHFSRAIDEIIEYLTKDEERPSYNEEILEVWKRRSPLYKQCSKFEFICPKDHSGKTLWPQVTFQFCQFVENLITGKYIHLDSSLRPAPLARAITSDYPSYFVCLTFKNLYDAGDDRIRVVTEGVSAIELRVDQLESQDTEFVSTQISKLRSISNLPIIFTIRTTKQGGAFDFNEETILNLYQLAIRIGMDYIDIEQQWPEKLKSKLYSILDNSKIRNQRTSKVIVSEHCYEPNLTESSIQHIMGLCKERGQSDIIKVVTKANTIDDTLTLRRAVSSYKTNKPLIALATSTNGQLSRILNEYLCPVTHPLLPVAAAPGQLTVQQINSARPLVGLQSFPTPDKMLYLFGNAITASPSPAMHNAGFQALSIPLAYSLAQHDTIEQVVEVLKRENTLGGNITMPFKTQILPYLQSITSSAQKIGAVNTIVKSSSGGLRGDNTDWIGIMNPILRTATAIDKSLSRGLVLGAGGTARAAIYAMQHGLSMKDIVICNPRTHSNAVTLADTFSISCNTLEELNNQHFDVIVSTLPPIGVTDKVQETMKQLCKSHPIVMDVVYFPSNTTTLQIAKENDCNTIYGPEMLLEQGLYGFEQWTNLRAPRSVMQTSLFSFQQSMSS